CGNESQYLTYIDGLDYRTDGEMYPNDTYLIRKGDRIAQLVIQPIPTVEAYEVKGELSETDRGQGGFGSTGYSTISPKIKDGKILFDRNNPDHRYIMEDD